jgi:protein-S-isoprenylcysteine O-methyltransferase Ste14
VRTWIVAAIWVVWFLCVSGVGYARPRSTDSVDRRATAVSVWADVITILSLAGGVVAAIAVPSATLPWDPLVAVGLGSALVLCGLAIRQWAATTLGDFFTRSVVIRDGQQIVTTGPYRFVGHPAYAGMLVSIVGLGLTLSNWLSVALAAAGFVLANVPRIRAEEAALAANLGEQYCEFALTRKRLIPGVW